MAFWKFPGRNAVPQKDTSFTEIVPSQSCHDDSTISISVAAEQVNVKSNILVKDNDDISGFDKEAGKVWIYPTNFPERTYQLTIAKHALFENTLVTLPTGLGKTFIAAVVMYNFYRWYPQGKVVFMAPTKPLVQQQLRACYEVMGIPQEHMILMTGASNSPQARIELWKERRVFFLTPQVMANDLRKGVCPAKLIKCLVIDEAHKATGNHAYCEVVRSLVTTAKQFRVLALSATPGGDVQAVQQVLTNLLITRMELRSEESLDVQPYCFSRETKKIVVLLSNELRELEQRFGAMVEKVLAKLERFNVIQKRPLSTWSKFQLLTAKDQFNQNPPPFAANQRGAIMGNFASAVSLLHAYELLLMYGMKSFRYFIQSTLDGDKNNSRSKGELSKSPEFQCFWNDIKTKLDTVSQADATSVALQSHPKLQELVNILLDHFKEKGNESTRVMIFSQYRPSVQEIGDLLKRYEPIIKPVQFVGQGQSGGASKGISQKEQMRVVREFQAGNYNTLVATCIGEEGLDIGEVDLIICYDAPSSPTRLVQRMGRTGRKRNGKIVVLVSEGKEEHLYNRSQYSKKKIHKAILANRKFSLYANNPRMIPDGIKPQLMKLSIKPNKPFDQKLKNKTVKGPSAAETLKFVGRRSLASYSGYLEADEIQFLKQNYEVDQSEERQVKALPRNGKYEILGHDRHKINSNRLDYGENIRDQAILQSVNAVAHSSRTVAFANVMNFCDFRRFLDAEDDSYALELRSFIQDENDLRKVQDGSVLFGRIERKNCLSEQEIGSGEKQNSQPIEQRSTDNIMDENMDEDNYLAQLWECGISSQACIPYRQESPLKQVSKKEEPGGVSSLTPSKLVPKKKEPGTPDFKPEVKANVNETPKLKIRKDRNASFSRKASKVGPLDFFVKREPNANADLNFKPNTEADSYCKPNAKADFNFKPNRNVVASRNANVVGSRNANVVASRNANFVGSRNANVVASRNANSVDNFSSSAATCSKPKTSKPVTIFDDDDDELLANCDFDFHNRSTVATNAIKIEKDSLQIESNAKSHQIARPKAESQQIAQPKTESQLSGWPKAESQPSAFPSTMQSNWDLNFDLDLENAIKPKQDTLRPEPDVGSQKNGWSSTMQSNWDLNFDLDLGNPINPCQDDHQLKSNAESQQRTWASTIPSTAESQQNVWASKIQSNAELQQKTWASTMKSTAESQSTWTSTMQSNCNLNFDLDLMGAEESEIKRSFPKTIATSEDETDVDVIPPTPERPKTRLVLPKLCSPVNLRLEKIKSSEVNENFNPTLNKNSQPDVSNLDKNSQPDASNLNKNSQSVASNFYKNSQAFAGNDGDDENLYRINPFLLGTIQYQVHDSSLATLDPCVRMMADSSIYWNIDSPAKSAAKPIETSTPAIGLRNRACARPGPSKRLIVSSDDDSPVISSKNQKKPKRILSDDEDDVDDKFVEDIDEVVEVDDEVVKDDEVIVLADNDVEENLLPPDSPAASGSEPPPSPPELNVRPVAQKRRKFQNEMIEFEASESSFADSQGQIRLPRSRDDTDVSTDDEEGWLPDSFVDWNSQPEYHSTQSGKDESEMYAVYVQSVKDQVGPSSGRYKLTYGLNADMDVFSQAPGPEYQQSYEMDTFCVPNDFVEYASGSDETGNAGLKSAGKQRRKRRPRKANQLGKRRRLADVSDSD